MKTGTGQSVFKVPTLSRVFQAQESETNKVLQVTSVEEEPETNKVIYLPETSWKKQKQIKLRVKFEQGTESS